ncbi:MAG: AMP-binding protein [Solirubrobacteraceae bacterium]
MARAASTMPSVSERRGALEAAYPAWPQLTLSEALDAAAARHPNRPFVIGVQRTYSYEEVREWSRRLAAGLVALNVSPGEHVAVVMANYPEFVALKFAIARAGAVAVPVNFLLRRDELAYVLKQSDASVLVTMDRFRDLDYLSALDQLIPGWEEGGGGERLPALRDVVVHGGARPEARLLGEVEDLADDAGLLELDARASRFDPLATADVIYTSGTSGTPKGVLLSHDALLRSAYGSAWTRAFQDGRRILFALPLYHVFAYVEGLLASLFAGGAIIPQTAFDPVATLQAIEKHRADEALFVPTMTIAVLAAAQGGRFDVDSLRAVMSAAAPAPVRLWQAVRDELGVPEIVTGYGMTETSAATTYTEPDGPLQLVANTVGRCKRGGVAGNPESDGLLVTYKTVDPMTGEDLPAGFEGELTARGPIVTHGYYNKPRETEAALSPDGWLRSGDLGRIEPDGSVVLTGRSNELYKCGAELVAPKEVEECLSSHPGVAQAYVAGLPDERMGAVGCAWVVPATGNAPSAGDLLEWCGERLARFKVPAQVRFLAADELPTTATGKVQKFRLIERAQAP